MNRQLPMPVVETPVTEVEYLVHSVFATIQGEGPFAGVPAVFIRLAGCNLQCPGCDTEYSAISDHRETTEQLMDWVKEISGGTGIRLAVITGGEPMRQPLAPLVYALMAADYQVQIETNGTIFREELPYTSMTVVCSPKVSLVDQRLIPHVTAWKYVVGDGQLDERGLPLSVLGSSRPVFRSVPADAQIYLQPLDVQDVQMNATFLGKTIEACLQHGHRLCIQVHKMVGLE